LEQFVGGRHETSYEVDTALTRDELAHLGEGSPPIPPASTSPKVQKLWNSAPKWTWASASRLRMGEALALASLLQHDVRRPPHRAGLRRGTFSPPPRGLIDNRDEELHALAAHRSHQAAASLQSSLSESAF